jgi:hypothetical protein
MNPDFRRFLPLVLIAVFAIFLLPSLLHRSHSSGLSNKDKAARTHDAVKLIENGERSYRAMHGRYTSHLADLVAASPNLAHDLVAGVDISLDVSTKGQSYVAQITSDVLSIVRVHTNGTLAAQSCQTLTSSSGVTCP